jgi:hypothetical protein
MLVIESNSRQFPTPRWKKREGDTVITIKWPTENTDYLCGRHISSRRNGPEYPFLCYKWNPPLGDRGGKFDDVPRDNIWQADWERWDKHYRSFGNVKHPDPSSGACAVYSVVERWSPDTVGLIGFNYVLDNNTEWMHDARAELESIKSIVTIIDLRDGSEIDPNRSKPCQQ